MWEDEDLDFDELSTIKDDDTPEAGIEKMNRAITALRSMSELMGDEGAMRAIADIRSALRTLRERNAVRPDIGPESELYRRYRVADQDASEGFRLRLRGEQVEGAGYFPGLLDDTREGRPEVQREMQRWIQRRAICRTLLTAIASSRGQSYGHEKRSAYGKKGLTPRCDAQIEHYRNQLPANLLRAFVDVSGSGGDWIPTDTLPILDEEIKYRRMLAGYFDEIEVDRDSTTLTLTGGFIPYDRAAVVDDDPAKTPKLSSLATGSNSIVLKNPAVRTLVSRNAVEDAILEVIGIIEREGVDAVIAGEEDCLVNGDTNATHQDTALATWNPDSYWPAAPGGGSQDHRKMWLGIRARAFDASNTVDRSTFTFDTLVADRGQLRGPKQGPRDVIALCSGLGIGAVAKLDQFQTLDKAGDAAYIRNGTIGFINGMPVVESQFATDDLDTSGLYTGSNSTGSVSLAITSRLRRVVKRGHGTRVESQLDIATNAMTMVWSQRKTYYWVREGSEKNVRYLFNIT